MVQDSVTTVANYYINNFSLSCPPQEFSPHLGRRSLIKSSDSDTKRLKNSVGESSYDEDIIVNAFMSVKMAKIISESRQVSEFYVPVP